jgi:fructuronate reductase
LGDLGDEKRAEWAAAGIRLPRFGCAAMRAATLANPSWVHFGAGNIFRGFIASLSQELLDQKLEERGIIAVEPFDFEIIDRIYGPHDCLSLSVGLRADGTCDSAVVASIAAAYKADFSDAAQAGALKRIFRSPGLQLASLTITEKGYALTGIDGGLLPAAAADMECGPRAMAGTGSAGSAGGAAAAGAMEADPRAAAAGGEGAGKFLRHSIGMLTALLLERYEAGARPIALVSMDNFSRNGEQLRRAVLAMAQAWQERGFCGAGFIEYLGDGGKVSFPWTMIDKITPRPSESVQRRLAEGGLALEPIATAKGTFIAPFVNAEIPQYLVIEDSFPNGRPPLEKAGVRFANRESVDNVERMKVTTCLNPLHTALAIFGCLLGYRLIADEMADPDLRALAERTGFSEGMPVVPGQDIIDPAAFLRELLDERLPNPSMPDTPQRIATDTSLKLPIRFGETLKSYAARDDLDPRRLECIPLILAAWCRYLLGADDELAPMELSGDPRLPELRRLLESVAAGKPESYRGQLRPLLANSVVFGADLYAVGLGERVESLFVEMLRGKGAVRRLLHKTVG